MNIASLKMTPSNLRNPSNPTSVYKTLSLQCHHALALNESHTEERRTLAETHTAFASLAGIKTLLLKTSSKPNTQSHNYALTDED